MNNKRDWKTIFVLAIAVLAVLSVLPTFVPGLPSAYTSIFSGQLNYGLDLKGGLELKYTVDYEKAISDNSNKLRDTLRSRLVDKWAEGQGKDPQALTDVERKTASERFEIERPLFNTLKVTFKKPEDAALLTDEVVDTIDLRFELRKEGTSATLFLSDKSIAEIKDEVVNQTLDVIRKRVDAFGLVEPDVRRSGDADVDVQLPGLNERQMKTVREKIGQAAQLTFRMVVIEAKVFDGKKSAVDTYKAANVDKAKTLDWQTDSRGAFIRSERKSELINFVKTVEVPDNVMIGYEFVEDKDPISGAIKERYYRSYNLQANAPLTGDNLTRAAMGYGEKREPVVNLEFDSRGASIFSDLTEKNVGNQMAIMLDGDVASAPRINERIGGGRAQITLGGGRSSGQQAEEAKALVTVLNNGAYKAPVVKVHDVEVGPSLGRDAVRSGMFSIALGFILAFLFMIMYYRQAGVIANVALLFNLVLVLACLVSFNAALTLPGMAGIVLTVGMALDANVLIFERVREEIRSGKSVRNALDLGYGKAFWTIFDAQITTAIAGFVLMQYATGPIYGFAVTMLIGIACSMFTSIVVTRMIYTWLLDSDKIQGELSI
ncbi:MAG TPA: protein translocase subunit SecD [Myxococcales bacterium]|nr:protein translocase subunit SecD [Myxococcales bacterium]HAN31588.1 protein translocase subunit SecD [Myxococcales bacterium]